MTREGSGLLALPTIRGPSFLEGILFLLRHAAWSYTLKTFSEEEENISTSLTSELCSLLNDNFSLFQLYFLSFDHRFYLSAKITNAIAVIWKHNNIAKKDSGSNLHVLFRLSLEIWKEGHLYPGTNCFTTPEVCCKHVLCMQWGFITCSFD